MSELEGLARLAPSQAAPSGARLVPSLGKFWHGLGHRLTGPGGFYNVGNALGLLGGIYLHVAAAGAIAPLGLHTGAVAALDYLAGSGSAVAITLAMLVFFWSGEVYHRAWAADLSPDRGLNRLGDHLSGYGALLLGLGLLLLGEPLLAATAGLLHAFGKFGSACHDSLPARLTRLRPDPFRSTVLISRFPAILLVLIEIGKGLTEPQSGEALLTPGLLLVCYLLWARADLLLFRSGD